MEFSRAGDNYGFVSRRIVFMFVNEKIFFTVY